MASQENQLPFDPNTLPKHVAVIMDGNRRWAKQRRLPVLMGHRAGVKAFRVVMETCRDIGIKALTAYAFSAENWRRSPLEVQVLMQLFEQYTRAEREKMVRTGIRFQPIGRYTELPASVVREFEKTKEATAGNTELTLNLAVNYGGRDEILEATRRIATEVQAGRMSPQDIDESRFSSFLYTAGQPDPDLLIRTSGELRISNFLLWQSAYTEFYFTDLYWPDVDREVILQALRAYQSRERRYGGGKA